MVLLLVAALSITSGSGSSSAANVVVILEAVFGVAEALPLLSMRPRPTAVTMLFGAIPSTFTATFVTAATPLRRRMVATVSTVLGHTERQFHDQGNVTIMIILMRTPFFRGK